MNDRTLLEAGIVGTIVAAFCRFTPVLVIVFGALGLSAWLGWIDYVLLPALGMFLAVTAWALIRLYRRKAAG